MKSPNKQDWHSLGLLAVQYAGEALECSCGGERAAKCIRHFSPQAILQWRKVLQKTKETYGSDLFFQEARFIASDLLSVSGRTATVEGRGVLLCYGSRSFDTQTDFASVAIFRLWLTCRCSPRSGTQRKNACDKNPSNRISPFQLQILDFDYETVH